MDQSRYAAVIPLDINTRTENMVFFYDENWDELSNLLEAPLEFLRGQQFMWPQEAAGSVSWQLLAPITATIECAFKDAPTLRHVLGLVGSQIMGSTVPNERRSQEIWITVPKGRAQEKEAAKRKMPATKRTKSKSASAASIKAAALNALDFTSLQVLQTIDRKTKNG